MNITKYGMSLYKFCPYRYKLTILDEVPAQVSYEKDKGVDFHDDAYHFFDSLTVQELLELTSYQDVLEYMKVRTKFDNFAEFEARRWWRYYKDRPWDYIPKLREHKITLEQDEFTLVGKIDRFDVFKNQHIIIEYKRKMTRDVKMELAYYWYLFNKVKPENFTANRVGVFVYEKDWKFETWLVHSNSLRAIFKVLNKLKRDKTFEKKEGDHCVYCDVAYYCQEVI